MSKRVTPEEAFYTGVRAAAEAAESMALACDAHGHADIAKAFRIYVKRLESQYAPHLNRT
jgi:hypothetical protein